MQGKTHAAAGILTAITLSSGWPLKEQTFIIPAAAVGALLPDIDLGDSNSSCLLRSVTAALFYVTAGVYTQDYSGVILESTSVLSVIGFIIFTLLCFYGKSTEHRTFTHSFVGMFLYTICMYMILPKTSLFFFAGYAGHLALDSLNKKKLNLFWPLRGSFYIGICKANGIVNKILLSVFYGLIGMYYLSKPVSEYKTLFRFI